MPSEVAYFFSDAHLGMEGRDREAAREARLRDFLKTVAQRATHLYVMGDLFDFWFEYRTAIPRRYFEILGSLRDVREAGVEITYLAGNHDFWLGSFITDELGIRFHDGALPLEMQGRRLWLHHGDGLVGGDLGYRILKRVLRNPACIALYRMIHPDLGIPLAHFVSRWSRGSREGRPLEPERLIREIARPRFAEGYDAVLIGHFHHPFHLREDGREFVILGDWIERFGYATLEGGRLSTATWPDQNWAANEKRWVSPRSDRSGT